MSWRVSLSKEVEDMPHLLIGYVALKGYPCFRKNEKLIIKYKCGIWQCCTFVSVVEERFYSLVDDECFKCGLFIHQCFGISINFTFILLEIPFDC